MKKLSLLALALSLVLVFSACGAAMSADNITDAAYPSFPVANAYSSPTSAGGNYYYDGYFDAYDKPMEDFADAAYNEPGLAAPASGAYNESAELTSSGTGANLEGRKIIKNGTFSLETLEYEKTVEAIDALVQGCGGYIQSSVVSGSPAIKNNGYYSRRRADYVIRIPSEGFNSFQYALDDCGVVTSRQEYINEVTDHYYDTEAHLKALQAEEEQLLELMKQATELDAIIMLHSSLSDVRYQIESLQGTLRRLDNQIAYSTITLYVQEVSEPTRVREMPKTLGERISDRFLETWNGIVSFLKDFVVFFAGNIIVIALWVIIITAAVLIIKRLCKKGKKKTSAAGGQPQGSKDEENKS